MRVLITRPQEDADAMAERLRAMGHEAVVVPLLEARFFDGPEISLDGVQAILATSANGARAIARRTKQRDIPIFAVGPQTSAAAHSLGFSNIRDADGDAEALAASVPEWTTPEKGALLHAAGADSPKLIATKLRDAGFSVRRESVYEVEATKDLPTSLHQYLKDATIEAAIFMSPRSAHIFAQLIFGAGLNTSTKAMTAFCISTTCEKALSPLQFRNIRVAAKPNQSALLGLFD